MNSKQRLLSIELPRRKQPKGVIGPMDPDYEPCPRCDDFGEENGCDICGLVLKEERADEED